MFEVGDSVRLKDWEEEGLVRRVEDTGIWVETSCNTYRNWSEDAFIKITDRKVELIGREN